MIEAIRKQNPVCHPDGTTDGAVVLPGTAVAGLSHPTAMRLVSERLAIVAKMVAKRISIPATGGVDYNQDIGNLDAALS